MTLSLARQRRRRTGKIVGFGIACTKRNPQAMFIDQEMADVTCDAACSTGCRAADPATGCAGYRNAYAIPADHPKHPAQGRSRPARRAVAAAHPSARATQGPTLAWAAASASQTAGQRRLSQALAVLHAQASRQRYRQGADNPCGDTRGIVEHFVQRVLAQGQ